MGEGWILMEWSKVGVQVKWPITLVLIRFQWHEVTRIIFTSPWMEC